MKLVFTCKLNIDTKYDCILNEISIHSSKFYNMVLYEYKNENYLSQNDYYNLFKEHFRSGYLQAHTYLHAIKQAMKDMKSFFALLEKYKENPVENQKPGIPRFKHDRRLVLSTFLKTAIRIRNGHLLLSLGKKMKFDKQIKVIDVELPEEVYGLLKDRNVKMITLEKCDDGRYEFRFVYEIKGKSFKKTGDLMAIDLGVSNLAAITFISRTDQYLISGNVLKSKIAGFNNQLAESYSKEMKITGSKNFRLTKKMKRQLKTRNGYINNYIHTASRKIVNLAIECDVNVIVIGDFKSIKHENKQKYFVQIPHNKLIEQIKYKAKIEGIKVKMQNEAYTSIVSSVDLDPVNKENAKKEKEFLEVYMKHLMV